ncbi:TetR/AcrR family transcriptional regulator [Microtetraspora malaysiensis]|uniref:TetR/AcrR family transcriptional regulator n=1 Tax=Microtetraspora malaysiensis TaxID=161358 RepID=UPI00082F78B1|nr:TetR/AcrR family transcriptional regulator C-terminal domain-containing protein [Microtetraspora malaysiensis]
MARRESLNREKVLDAALDLADREGLEGLSMRRLAKTLGVEAMSLYNHVSNKADLVDGIVERVFEQVEPPDPALPWPEQVRATALSMHRVFSLHPVVPLALATDRSNPTSPRAMGAMDGLVGALFQAGFDERGAWRALGAINGLVYGALLLATAGFTGAPGAHAGEEQVGVYIRRLDPARLPHFSRLLGWTTQGDVNPAADFEQALDMLIQGLEATAKSGHSG